MGGRSKTREPGLELMGSRGLRDESQARPDSGEKAWARSLDGRYGLERGHVGNQLEAVAGPRACG